MGTEIVNAEGNTVAQPTSDGTTVIGIRLSGTPATDSNADKSNYAMVYKATDSDATGADSAEVVFGVTIQKSPVAVAAPPPGQAPSDNELLELTVTSQLVDKAVTNNTLKPREDGKAVITPEFKSDIVSYRVSIPYEVEEVTIKAKPVVADSTVKLISRSGQPLFLSTLSPEWTHTFSELSEGSNDPVRIEVTPPDGSDLSAKTYSIIIGREYNTPAQFDTSAKPQNLNYWDRVKIDDPVPLPGGRLGNGDTTESATAMDGEWRYDLSLKTAYDGRSATGGYPYDTLTVDDYANGKRTQKNDTWLPTTPGFTFTVSYDADADATVRAMNGHAHASDHQRR